MPSGRRKLPLHNLYELRDGGYGKRVFSPSWLRISVLIALITRFSFFGHFHVGPKVHRLEGGGAVRAAQCSCPVGNGPLARGRRAQERRAAAERGFKATNVRIGHRTHLQHSTEERERRSCYGSTCAGDSSSRRQEGSGAPRSAQAAAKCVEHARGRGFPVRIAPPCSAARFVLLACVGRGRDGVSCCSLLR